MTRDHENKYKKLGYNKIVGMDEVGRGALASVVVVAGVILPGNFDISEINDSKKLTPKKRQVIALHLGGDEDVE